MEDINILQLEIKALRIQNQSQKAELELLRRYKQLVERAGEVVDGKHSPIKGV